MRVLLTGDAGFIGSAIADTLEIVALDTQVHGVPPETRHPLVCGDVHDAEPLRGVDAVCHQAVLVGHGVDPSDMPDHAAHNDLGTAVLLAAMRETGVRRLALVPLLATTAGVLGVTGVMFNQVEQPSASS